MPKAKLDKRYFAQVGAESIEVDADALKAHLATSAPILFYRVRATSGSATFEGIGQTWAEAEDMIDKQAGDSA